MRNRIRAALAIAALPLLAGCWWLEHEPGPGEWRHRDGTIGDFQPHHVASLFENDGAGQLIMECSQGPIDLRLASGRDPTAETVDRQPLRYRFDDSPPVATHVVSDGNYLFFRDPATSSGEDPMVARIGAARRLTIRIDWSPTDRQLLRFDIGRAAAAAQRLRQSCAAEQR